MKQGNAVETRLEDYTPPTHNIEQVDLNFDIQDDHTLVTSELTVYPNPEARSNSSDLVLFGENLELKEIYLNGTLLPSSDYTIKDGSLTIPNLTEGAKIKTVCRIEPQKNKALSGLYQSGDLLVTQCEAEGFRRITYFPDRPDVMAKYKVRIEADKKKYPVLLANPDQTDGGDLDGGRHFVSWDAPHPKPSYLFALMAGDMEYIEDKFTTMSGRDVTIRIYTPPGDTHKVTYAMDAVKRSMKWDEDVYGREYDADVFMVAAVNDFNAGAMENKGLNIFNSPYIYAEPQTATDANFQTVESVIAHEYFHNWSGNRVTCRDWFQLSLKEGLTVFRDQEFSSDMNSRGVCRIGDVQALRVGQFPEDAGPLAHPVRPEKYEKIDNFYTATVYNKGAEVIRMMHRLLGAERYRKGTDLYFERHDGQAVTCEDFVRAMEDANNVDLRQFRLWYSQAGTPKVTAKWSYDEEAKKLTLILRQSTPPTPGQDTKQAMVIPVQMGLLDQESGEEVASKLLVLNQPEQVFEFDNIEGPVVPSLLREFSAPVRLEANYSDADLTLMMAHDTDQFNQWEAGQRLSTNLLMSLIKQAQEGENLKVPRSYLDAIDKIIDNATKDPAFTAKALGFPPFKVLAEEMAAQGKPIDAQAIIAAQKFLKKAIAEEHGERLIGLHHRMAPLRREYEPTAEAMGRRALRNLSLAFAAKRDDKKMPCDLAATNYEYANNMTDRLSALALLVNNADERAGKTLDDYFERFKDDLLVVNKWFAIQATAEREDALDQVKKLMKHPAYNPQNPNTVGAVISQFTHNNPLGFHAKDGEGYRFLAEQTLAADKINPQLSARLVAPLMSWKKFAEPNRRLMQQALQKIAASGKISANLSEKVSKALAEEGENKSPRAAVKKQPG